jgi:hypothetical protein
VNILTKAEEEYLIQEVREKVELLAKDLEITFEEMIEKLKNPFGKRKD